MADEPPRKPRHFFANAADEGVGHWGWFVGHFMGGDEHPLHSSEVELKWGEHRRGERRAGVAPGADVTALTLLLRGRFALELDDREYVLERPGDFVIWAPGVAHSWRVEEDCLVLTVRWPSRGGAAPRSSAPTAPGGAG